MGCVNEREQNGPEVRWPIGQALALCWGCVNFPEAHTTHILWLQINLL